MSLFSGSLTFRVRWLRKVKIIQLVISLKFFFFLIFSCSLKEKFYNPSIQIFQNNCIFLDFLLLRNFKQSQFNRFKKVVHQSIIVTSRGVTSSRPIRMRASLYVTRIIVLNPASKLHLISLFLLSIRLLENVLIL